MVLVFTTEQPHHVQPYFHHDLYSMDQNVMALLCPDAFWEFPCRRLSSIIQSRWLTVTNRYLWERNQAKLWGCLTSLYKASPIIMLKTGHQWLGRSRHEKISQIAPLNCKLSVSILILYAISKSKYLVEHIDCEFQYCQDWTDVISYAVTQG